MPIYYVDVPEVHYYKFKIEANSKEDAIDRAVVEGDILSTEYSHTLDPDEGTWYIEGEDHLDQDSFHNGKWLSEELDKNDSDRGDNPVEFSESSAGYVARENWARNYDDLNGAPEGPDDY